MKFICNSYIPVIILLSDDRIAKIKKRYIFKCENRQINTNTKITRLKVLFYVCN